MLTIRIVRKCGDEIIKEVETVSFMPASDQNSNPMLFIWPPNEKNAETIEDANVYVMNSEGKTVGIYNL